MRPRSRWFLPVLLLLVGAAQPGLAEDDAPPSASERVREALAKLLSMQQVNWQGHVTVKQSSAGSPLNSGAVIVNGGTLGSQSPFQGAFEARASSEETTILSAQRLPGFGIYSDADRQVTRATYEDAAPNVSSFTSDVLALLDRTRLKKWLSKADWTALPVEDGAKPTPPTFSATVAKRIVPALHGGIAQIAAPEVLEATARIALDEHGDVRSVEVTIQRSDPMQAMVAQQLRAQGLGGRGRGSGTTTTYSLERSKQPLSAAFGRFRSSIREELGLVATHKDR